MLPNAYVYDSLPDAKALMHLVILKIRKSLGADAFMRWNLNYQSMSINPSSLDMGRLFPAIYILHSAGSQFRTICITDNPQDI